MIEAEPHHPLDVPDRFEVRRTLGAGMFGVVYEVFDRERDEVVALKTLHRQNADEVYHFKQEFRVLADLTHPNLVTLYDLVWNGDQLCFTMELVEGVPFLEYVGHPADPERLRRAIVQLSDGLTALHRAGKLHRDIKPSNVLVSTRGRVVLLDFGLASDLRQRPGVETAGLSGTPAYMSPEQRSGAPLASASDWYSVGVMVHEALTGRLPPANGSLDLLRNAQDRWTHPADLVEACASLLHRNAERRADGRRLLGRLTPALLGIAEPHGMAGTATAPPFVGRERELEVLRAMLGEVTRGAPRAVFLDGSSGIGKSALVARFLDEIRADHPDTVVLTGRCYEREAVPFKALDALVDALSRVLTDLPPAEVEAILPEGLDALVRLFPVLDRVPAIASAGHPQEVAGSEQTRRLAFRALRDLLSNLARARRVVLLVDDLQWGDVDSAPLLAEIIRPPEAPPLLLVGVYRNEERDSSPFLGALRGFHDFTTPGESTTVLSLGELARDDAERLALAHIGRPSEPARARAAAIAREARGNPFFIGALAGLATTRLVALDGSGRGYQQDDLETSPESFTLDAVVERRVALLPREARTLLEVVAIAGQPIRRSLARRAAGLGREYQGAVAVLGAAGLIRSRRDEPEDLLETFHDRIRESVVSHLTPEVRRQRHAALAAELERLTDLDLETLALHHQAGGNGEKAAHYAVLAADRAFAALAFERASRLYRMALDLAALPDQGARDLSVKLGDALASAGRGAEAAAAYLAAAEGAAPADGLEWRRRAAQQLLGSGRLDQGLAVLDTVLDGVQMRLARTERRALVSLLLRRLRVRLRGLGYVSRPPDQIPAEELTRVDTCWSVAGMLSWVDTIRGADFQVRHLLLALDSGDLRRVTRALALEAAYSATAGVRSRKRTAAILDACRAAATESGAPYARAISIGTLGGVAFMEARWREAVERCLEADRIYRDQCQGVAWERDTVEFFVLGSLFYLGEWRELTARLSAVMHDARLRGDILIDAVASIRFATLERLLADAPDEAAALIDNALGQWTQRGFHLQHFYALQQRVHVALYRDDAETAWRELLGSWSKVARSGLLRVQTLRIDALFLRARVALAAAGRPGVAGRVRRRLLRVAERAAERIAAEQALHAAPTADLLRAGIASLRRDRAQAGRLLTSADDGFRAADMTAHAMIARRRRGQLSGGERGRSLAESADQHLAGQGARRPDRISNVFAPGAWEGA